MEFARFSKMDTEISQNPTAPQTLLVMTNNPFMLYYRLFYLNYYISLLDLKIKHSPLSLVVKKENVNLN